jgi:hypothetical protein
MSRLSMMIPVGFSPWHAGGGIGDNGQHPVYVASSALRSRVAQAPIDWSLLCTGSDPCVTS